jgi:hypothetical protein
MPTPTLSQGAPLSLLSSPPPALGSGPIVGIVVGALAGLSLLVVGLYSLRGKINTRNLAIAGTAAAVEMAPALEKGGAFTEVAVWNPMGVSRVAARDLNGAQALKVQAPPLPSGWTEHSDESDTWYVGPNGESQWEKPRPVVIGLGVHV